MLAKPIIHLRGDYLLIVTIGIVEIVRIALTNNLFGLTGGANGIYGIARPSLFGMVFSSPKRQFYLIWTFTILTMFLFYVLEHSRFGRALNYIRYDDLAASGCGIDVTRYKLMAFTVGAFWAGMVGTLFAANIRTIEPTSFNFYESVILFAIVILGGSGSIAGVVLGAFLLIGLQDVFREFESARMLIFGAAMMVMMIICPQGLLPPRRRFYNARFLVGRFPPRRAAGRTRKGGGVMSLLILRNLLKTFGGLVAMNSVTFSVDEASIVGLIGPNGAGKTTTFNIITGNYRPTPARSSSIEGHYRQAHPQDRGIGIARTFQNIRLFQDMSVLENVLAGCHCRMRAGLFPSLFRTPAQRSEERQAVERAMRELAFVGLDDQYANLAGNLAYGNQRLLEIARALASEPRFLILDEPAGGMNDQETADLMLLIKAIQKRGITILLIEHDMNLVMRVCEKIVVLENGALIAEGTSAEIKRNPRVIEAYLGAEG